MNLPLPNVAISVLFEALESDGDAPPTDWLAASVRHGLAQILEPSASGQVSLLITDDATVRALNRQYRGLDETTDVLSFSAEHAGHWEGVELAPSPTPDHGEIEAHESPVSASHHGDRDLAIPSVPSPSDWQPDCGDAGDPTRDRPSPALAREVPGEVEPYFPIPDAEPPPLGDIVISLPQAKRQAEQQGTSLCRELALLLVHGALHLLGHDHYDQEERAAMQNLERIALARIFGDREA